MDLAPMLALESQRLLEMTTPAEVRRAIGEAIRYLTRACAVSVWEGDEPKRRLAYERPQADPGADHALERDLLRILRPIGPALSTRDHHADPGLTARCRAHQAAGRHVQVRQLRAHGAIVGAVAFHLRDGGVLDLGAIDALRRYCPAAGVALAAAYDRDRLRRLAFTDDLTGILNRRRILDVMADLAAAGHRLAILFVDFDGLKAVNETLTYDHGDEVIAAVGRLLGEVADDDHVPGRLGGDEFVVVMPGADAERAAADAEALSAALALLPVTDEIRPLFRGASVGWAVAGEGEDHDALRRRAAAEMRAVKARRKEIPERR